MNNMQKKTKLLISVAAAVVLIAAGLLLFFLKGKTTQKEKPLTPIEITAQYVVDNAPAEFGLEWVAVTMKKGGYACGKEWLEKYKVSLENNIPSTDDEHTQFTTYERCIITLCVLDMNPSDNLMEKISDTGLVTERGLNSVIYALLALDAVKADNALIDEYIEIILSRQQESGGFGLNPNYSDVDITAMTLQALAPHMDRDDVKATVDKAVTYLSEAQRDNGEFATMGQPNSQSLSQVILALDAVGIPMDDERFIKEGKTLLDIVEMYRRDDGGYARLLSEDKSMFSATLQVLEALTALKADEPFFG